MNEQLLARIRSGFENGRTRDEVITDLLKSGWKVNDINEALGYHPLLSVHNPPHYSTVEVREPKRWVPTVIVSCIALLIAGAIAADYYNFNTTLALQTIDSGWKALINPAPPTTVPAVSPVPSRTPTKTSAPTTHSHGGGSTPTPVPTSSAPAPTATVTNPSQRSVDCVVTQDGAAKKVSSVTHTHGDLTETHETWEQKYKIVTPPTNGGKACPSLSVETETTVPGPIARVNCVVASAGDLKKVSSTAQADGSTKEVWEQKFKVVTPAANGGIACPALSVTSERTIPAPAVPDCIASKSSGWLATAWKAWEKAIALVTHDSLAQAPCVSQIPETDSSKMVEKWVPIQRFGLGFTLSAPATVRLGSHDDPDRWRVLDFPAGDYSCSHVSFVYLAAQTGSIQCEQLMLVPDDGWDYQATDYSTFTMPYDGVARFTGPVGTSWLEIEAKKGDRVGCDGQTFGGYPAWGEIQICKTHPYTVAPKEVAVSLPMDMAYTVGMPKVAYVPPPSPYGTSQLTLIRGEGVISTGDIGAFRTECKHVKFDFIDPIVSPGKPGAAHLHEFFCATNVDAYTTQATLDQSPSTSDGGILDRSTKWAPAVLDENGRPILGATLLSYYKCTRIPCTGTIWPPKGLKMIFGAKPMNTDPANTPTAAQPTFPCINAQNGEVLVNGLTFPSCPPGQMLWINISAPNCWDGVHLDSADHRSHMAYKYISGQTWVCPASHPVEILQYSAIIMLPVPRGADTTKWKLSSDDASAPKGGASAHFDVWFNWNAEQTDIIMANCHLKDIDCHRASRGDGWVYDAAR